MGDTLDLPPLYIYPDDYGVGLPPGGASSPTPPPAVVIARAQSQRDIGYSQGNWWSVFVNLLHSIRYNVPKYSFDFRFKGDFVAAHYADYLKATQPSISNADAWKAGRDRAARTDLYGKPALTTETQFSGGIFSPMKAFAHFFLGNGTPASVPLANIGITPTPGKIPALQAAINAAGPGVTNIDMNVAYATGQDSQISRYYLGSITLRIVGQVTRKESGAVTFTGEARAYDDTYDANASDHRNDFDESATTALREFQNLAKGVVYQISMPGSIPINYTK